MVKVSVYIAVSVDGFIAREDGGLDWLECVGGSDEDYGFKQFVDGLDGVILGRKTYEVAVTAFGTPQWPYSGKRLIVLSASLDKVVDGAEIYGGDLDALMAQLHGEGIQHVWVDGGSTISQFLRLNLVDEMILSVIPIILGSGIRLFDVGKEIPVRLINSKKYPSSLVQMKYGIDR